MKKFLIITLTSTLIACASSEKKPAAVIQKNTIQENAIQEDIIVSKNKEIQPEEKKKVIIEKEGISLLDVASFTTDLILNSAIEAQNDTKRDNLKKDLPSGSRVNNH